MDKGAKSLRKTVDIDGVLLGPSTDYLEVVREQLKDGSVWPGETGPEEGLWHAIDASSGTDVQRRLLEALMSLLKDPDVEVRTRAVATAPNYAREIDPQAIVVLLQNNPELYKGVKPLGIPDTYMPDLAWGLIQTLTASPEASPDAISVLRMAAVDPGNGFRVLGGLAAKDPEWLIEHAGDLISGEPVRAGIVLANLTTARRRERFIQTLASGKASFKRDLVDIVNAEIKNSGERQRLTALLA